MRARQLITDASYGPEALKVLFQAFDNAWESIAGNFGNDPLTIDNASVMLANIILSLPHTESSNAESIKNTALQVMALRYRKR
jgi:hypothetical protein